MTYKLVYTSRAQFDLLSTYNGVLEASRDEKIASKYILDLEAAVASKLDFPYSVKTLELNLPLEIHEFTFKAYKVFYFVENDSVIILRILPAKSDFVKQLLLLFR